MKLTDLTEGLEAVLLQGTMDKDVKALVYFSEEAAEGSAFFAIPGAEKNGMDYVQDAAGRGADVVFTEEVPEAFLPQEITVLQVSDVRRALARASCNFYGNPCREMIAVGVTGTKGKTSTTYMMRSILEEAGVKTGLIGTVKNGWDGCFEEADRTTPQSLDIQRWCRRMADAGCGAVVMEVSSQGLMQSRVDGITFDIGIFTNLSPDHIGPGEHKNFEEYACWKASLLQKCRAAVINSDDRLWQDISRQLMKEKPAGTLPETVVYFGKGPEADYRCNNLQLTGTGERLGVSFQLEDQNLQLALPGYFNAANAAGAAAAARQLGIRWNHIRSALAAVRVPGRVEPVDTGGRTNVLVDYAHNGMALEHLLRDLRLYQPKRLIAVFGCGGNRDKSRRYEMGRAAAQYADFTIVTSDNPRNEPPDEIIKDITGAMDRAIAEGARGTYIVVADRAEAIRRAAAEGGPEDIVLIAGKGHETYQLAGGKKTHFDDREIVKNIYGGT